jgi:dCMP deaminase
VSRPTLDEYYLAMVDLVASRGTCPRRQVGAVLVDAEGKLVGTGYNGNAGGMVHCIDTPCPGAESLGGPRELCEAIHAEASVLLQAQASRRQPHTIYLTTTPCFPCAKLLRTAGIKRVVAKTIYKHDSIGVAYLQKAGVSVELMETA